MPLSRSQATASLFSSGASTNRVTASFTPPNSSILVVLVGGETLYTNDWTPTISGGSLSWTRQAYSHKSIPSYPTCYAITEIWTAPVTSGASMTVTASLSQSMLGSYVGVYAFTGYNPSTPIGATGTFTANAGASTPSITLSVSPLSSSEVIGLFCADAASISYTAGSGCTFLDSAFPIAGSGEFNIAVQYRDSSTSTNFALTGSQSLYGACGCAIEIKAPQPSGFVPSFSLLGMV